MVKMILLPQSKQKRMIELFYQIFKRKTLATNPRSQTFFLEPLTLRPIAPPMIAKLDPPHNLGIWFMPLWCQFYCQSLQKSLELPFQNFIWCINQRFNWRSDVFRLSSYNNCPSLPLKRHKKMSSKRFFFEWKKK